MSEEKIELTIPYERLRAEGIQRGLLVPVDQWTDDEWLGVLTTFPPRTDTAKAELWVAEQRKKAAQ